MHEARHASRAGGWLASYIPPGERVIVAIKPDPLFIVLSVLGRLVAVAVLAWGVVFAAGWFDPGVGAGAVWVVAVVLIGAQLTWQAAEWICRLYVLTDRRVIKVSGVLRQHAVDLPLSRLQHLMVYRSIRERVFGLGTLGFASAGTGWTELYWVMVRKPGELLASVRRAGGGGVDSVCKPADRGEDPPAVDGATSPPAGAGGEEGGTAHTGPLSEEGRGAIGGGRIVIGLAGGIGAGKSEVARILAECGCWVYDADAAARAALELPDVKRQIVEWWGAEMLTPEGHVSRIALAAVVFSNPDERKKLEGLIHPKVIRSRAELLGLAGDAPAAIIDAPLLFEAGIDAECDAVIFVDASREHRLERVGRDRGWDEAELARREAAQMPVEEKRKRSDHVVANEGSGQDLRRGVEAILGRLGVDWRGGGKTA